MATKTTTTKTGTAAKTAKATKATKATKAATATKTAKTAKAAKTTKSAKAAAPAARATRTQPEVSFYLQYANREYSFAEIRQLVLDKCEAEEMDPKDLRIYVKPGDDKAYYTCAGGSSSIAL